MTTIEDRYQILNKLIALALRKYHPDTYRGSDPETSKRMTRGLIGARRKARATYSHLTDAERAQIEEDLRREG